MEEIFKQQLLQHELHQQQMDQYHKQHQYHQQHQQQFGYQHQESSLLTDLCKLPFSNND